MRHLPPLARLAFLHAVAGLLPADHAPGTVDIAVRAVLAAFEREVRAS